MSILLLAIVPPRPAVLSLKIAMAFYVAGISTPEVLLESPPLLGTLTRGSGIFVEPREGIAPLRRCLAGNFAVMAGSGKSTWANERTMRAGLGVALTITRE